MATIADVRAAGTDIETSPIPLYEPLNPPEIFTQYLGRFGEEYNTSKDSHLYKLLSSLCGDSGAGAIKKQLLLPRLQSQLEATYFTNLDRLYGDALALPRLSSEFYTIDPSTSTLTQEEWADIFAKDSSYRARCLLWMRAIIEGPTPKGMSLAAEAASGVECDIFEQFRYLDSLNAGSPTGITNIGQTLSRSEFIIIPREPALTEEERRRMMRMVDKLRPYNTLPTIYDGDYVRLERPVIDVASSSDRFYIQRLVTGRSDVTWPDVDLTQGYWIESGVEKEAPTFAFMDRQEGVIYLDVIGVNASSQHIGLFNKEQQQLFVHLADKTLTDFFYSADRSYTRNTVPLTISTPWIGQSTDNVILINNYYPIGYFAQQNTLNFAQNPPSKFWASEEEFAANKLISADLINDFNYIADADGITIPFINNVAVIPSDTDVFRVVIPGIADPIANAHLKVPVQANSTYTFSGHVETSRVVDVNLRFLNDSTGSILETDSIRVPAGDFSVTFTTPEGATNLNPNIHVYDLDSGETVSAYDFRLVENQTTEFIEFDFGRTRTLNFIDFEICQKPIDFNIQWLDGDGVTWNEVEPVTFFQSTDSVDYLPSNENPWHYFEQYFTVVESNKLRITFTRRDTAFPLVTSDPFKWSIEVKNLRIMFVVPSADEYAFTEGTDILGNSYRTDLQVYTPDNVIDDDVPGEAPTFWQSQPNPSRFAVEALYFDLRGGYQVGTQVYLDQFEQSDLDTRSQADMELYYEDGVIIDEVFIDPVTFGPSMHIYYSLDDTPDWDNKLWTPVPRSYKLKKGFAALPAPTFVKYIKLEFTNLVASPYQALEHPRLPPVTYRRHPTWVQDYFDNILPWSPADQSDIVTINPQTFGFVKTNDLFDTTFTDVRTASKTLTTSDDELRNFIATLSTPVANDQEDKINFYSPLMWQSDLIANLDLSRALSRIANQPNEITNDTGWNSELGLPISPEPTVQSVADLSLATTEKFFPDLWFPRRCRHTYQILQADRIDKIAYFVSVRTVGFYRRDFTSEFDELYYVESLDDSAHVELNQFDQDDWRFTVTP